MQKFILSILIFISSDAIASNLQINFFQNDFQKSYNIKVIVDGSKFFKIKETFKYRKDIKSNIPIIEYSEYGSLTETEKEILLNKLTELEFNSWKTNYEVKVKKGYIFTCDGISFSFYIKSKKSDKFVSGNCSFPDNYKQLVDLLWKIGE